MAISANLRFDEYQYRFDYLAQVDGNPAYQGMSAPGVAETEPGWIIYLWEYDGSRQAISRKVAFKVKWSERTTVSYS